MAQLPKFTVDQAVYLMSSAKQAGRLESFKISQVISAGPGVWVYKIAVPSRPPTNLQTVGDRNTLQHSSDFLCEEAEFGTLCDVIPYAKAYLQAALAKLTALEVSYCTPGSSGG